MSVTLVEQDLYYLLTLPEEGKFNPEFVTDMNKALDDIEASDGTGAQGLIITGQGKVFSQGLDLEYLGALSFEDIGDFVNQCLAILGRLLTFPMPVCSAVNGHAFGMGAFLVFACECRVMRADRGYMCLPEVDLGMTLAPAMNAMVKARLSGALLRDVVLGGKRLGGTEAMEKGVVDVAVAEAELISAAQSQLSGFMGKDRKTFSKLKADLNQEILAHIVS